MAWGMKNYTIQLFGSSIIEGRIGVERAADRWYEIMRRQLCEMFPATCFAVYNGAVGGKSARVLMERFDGELFGHTPDLCIAMFGWNNCRMDDPAQRVELPELKELMEKFLTHLPQKTRVVGVINQPVVDEWHSTFKNPNYDPIRAEYGGFNAYHDFEREAAREFFRRHDFPFVDLAVLMADDPKKYVVNDGIHLSPYGHQFFAAETVKVLEPILRADGCC